MKLHHYITGAVIAIGLIVGSFTLPIAISSSYGYRAVVVRYPHHHRYYRPYYYGPHVYPYRARYGRRW